MDSQGLRALSEEISREFAPRLEHTALVLYDRDPGHLQAQWYVAPEDLIRARSLFPVDGEGLHQILRLRCLDQDGKAEVVASAPQASGVLKGEGEECFDLQGDGAEYECELGLESDHGGWVLLARSSRIRLANPSLPSPRSLPEASDIQARETLQGKACGPFELEDIPVEAALAAVSEPLYPVFPNLVLDDAPAQSRPASGAEVLGQVQARDRKTEGPLDVLKSPVPHPDTAVGAPLDAALEAMPPPLLPSSPNLRTPAPDMPGPRYDPRAALSSASVPGIQPQLADMEVQVELIVQGRALPCSTVDLFGQSVSVGDDGRFYIRRPIDDPTLLSLLLGGQPLKAQVVPESE